MYCEVVLLLLAFSFEKKRINCRNAVFGSPIKRFSVEVVCIIKKFKLTMSCSVFALCGVFFSINPKSLATIFQKLFLSPYFIKYSKTNANFCKMFYHFFAFFEPLDCDTASAVIVSHLIRRVHGFINNVNRRVETEF